MADKNAAAQKKAAADKKAAANRKAVANQSSPAQRSKSTSERKRDERSQLLTVSVSVNTGKVAGLISIGVIAAAVLVTALTFIVN